MNKSNHSDLWRGATHEADRIHLCDAGNAMLNRKGEKEKKKESKCF